MGYSKGRMERQYNDLSKALDDLGDAYMENDGPDYNDIGKAYKKISNEIKSLGADIEDSYEEMRKDLTLIAKGIELHFKYIKSMDIAGHLDSLQTKLSSELKQMRLKNYDYTEENNEEE